MTTTKNEGKNKPRPVTIHHPALKRSMPAASIKWAAAWLGTEFLQNKFPDAFGDHRYFMHEQVVRYLLLSGHSVSGPGPYDGLHITDGHSDVFGEDELESRSVIATDSQIGSSTSLQSDISTDSHIDSSTYLHSTLQAQCEQSNSTVKAECMHTESTVLSPPEPSTDDELSQTSKTTIQEFEAMFT